MLKTLAFLALGACLSSCGDGYNHQISAIELFFKTGRTGSSSDYYLVKIGLAGPDKVAVIFGFMDDKEFCEDIAKLYMSKYPAASYRCEKANN